MSVQNVEKNYRLNSSFAQIPKSYLRHVPRENGGGSQPEYDESNSIEAGSAEDIDTATASMSASATGASLPILATANDVREAVRFLKGSPSGLSIVEVLNAEPRRVFDARKIAAYEFWGIIEREGALLKLTALGNELADTIDPEKEVHRRIIRSVPAYMAVIEWANELNLKIITHFDVLKYWQEEVSLDLSPDWQRENLNEAVVVSFFSLCHVAELGVATVGKRGQPARLRIETEQVRAFLRGKDNRFQQSEHGIARRNDSFLPVGNEPAGAPIHQTFISGKNDAGVIENLCAALELADFKRIIFNSDYWENGFLSPSQIEAMQQCQAAVFLLDSNDFQNGSSDGISLRNERLTEINVAMALFNRRVIILWHDSAVATPPDMIKDYELSFFASQTFDWQTGVNIVNLLKKWQREF